MAREECRNVPRQVVKQECYKVPRQQCRNVPKQVERASMISDLLVFRWRNRSAMRFRDRSVGRWRGRCRSRWRKR